MISYRTQLQRLKSTSFSCGKSPCFKLHQASIRVYIYYILWENLHWPFFVIGKWREIHHVFMAYGWIMLNQPRRYWASGGLRHLGGSRSTCQGRGWNWSCYSWMFLFPLGFIVYPLFLQIGINISMNYLQIGIRLRLYIVQMICVQLIWINVLSMFGLAD